MFKSRFFQTYLLPGFVFQSITIGGGYGTGRELVEFFMTQGPLQGLLGMCVSLVIWSVVMAVSFELARIVGSYDYRSFIRSILGKGWLLYEVVYGIGLILVISVLGSAAGELVNSMFGIPGLVGILLMMILVGLMAFYGTRIIEKALSVWSIALYGAFFILIVVSFVKMGDLIGANIVRTIPDSKWFMGGITYSAYNIGIMPAMIFVVRHLKTRKEAVLSGIAGGAIAIIPGFFIYISLLSAWPGIMDVPVPVDYLLTQLNFSWFTVVFRVILFGTFVETGVGLIHGLNERIAGVYQEKGKEMPGLLRSGVAIGVLMISVFVADAIGIVDLIAKGYAALTWGYMAAFVFPVLTIGVYRIMRK